MSGRSRRIGRTAEPERVLGYVVRYSARAKRLQIRVRPWFGVEIVAPQHCSAARVERFVLAQREWIDNAIRSLPPAPPADSLPQTVALPAIGRDWGLRYGAPVRAVGARGGILYVPADVDAPAVARQQLCHWLAATARRTLLPRLDVLARRYGFSYQKVSVRGQRTRWGSCSARKHLSINYKLLFVAPDLVDYLFVHELAHTRHLNHSARFWRLVEDCLPDYRELERRMNLAWKDVPGWVEMR